MSCLLCLEEIKDTINCINLRTKETHNNIAEIILLHCRIDTNELTNETICTSCWTSLYTFHQFYIRIQQCQELLKKIPPKHEIICEEIGKDHLDEVHETIPKKVRNCKRKNNNFLIEEKATYTLNHVAPEPEQEKSIESSLPSELSANDFLKIIETEYLNDNLEEGNNTKVTDPLANRIESSKEVAEKLDSKNKYTEMMEVTRRHDEFIKIYFRLNCQLCELILNNFDELKRHFRKEHNMRGYAFCCKKKFLKRGLLVDHLHVHRDPNYFRCKQCGKTLADRHSLENHTKVRHGKERERIFKCEVCTKSFFSRPIYERHKLLHIPDEQKKFICEQCHKPFGSEATLRDHMKFVHLLTNANICDQCGKMVRGGMTALQQHQQEHTGAPREPINCKLCGLTLKTKYGLVRHMKRQHSTENQQPRECPYCKKMSSSLTAHNYHIKFVHQLERKYACNMCDKAFKRSRDLKEHMTTHTGEVLYTCPHCPKTFNSHANMHSHRKKMHRKEWEEARLQKYRLDNIHPMVVDNTDTNHSQS